MAVALVLLFVFAVPGFAQTAATYSKAATEFARQKSWDEAIADYRKALELEPNDPLTHYNLALALKYKGESSGAATEFQAALRLKPKWADAYYGLGATRYDLRDLTTAAKELRAALALEPTNLAARRLLAHIYLEQNDPASAGIKVIG
jgi:cytochrome c-type biogenesis protein CcmH/NrfG